MSVINTNGTGGGSWSDTLTWDGGVIPVSPDTANILAGDTVDEVPVGETASNRGTVTVNNGTITSSIAGSIVTTNNGTITLCRADVVDNNGTIGTLNGGTVVNNNTTGVVTLMAVGTTITNNNGSVVASRGLITTNRGTVSLNDATGPGTVTYNYGEVTINNGVVTYLSGRDAIVGLTSIDPNFDVGAIGDLQSSSIAEAGVVRDWNDHFLNFGDNVGKP